MVSNLVTSATSYYWFLFHDFLVVYTLLNHKTKKIKLYLNILKHFLVKKKLILNKKLITIYTILKTRL